jgi:hypothetical protein
VGSILGSLAGAILAAKTHLTPDLAVPLIAAITAISTAVFHRLGMNL